MYSFVAVAFASALLILVPSEAFARGGGQGGGHGGGHVGFSVGHVGGSFGAVRAGSVGFRALPSWHVVHHRRHNRNVFINVFIGGYSSYDCYPVWNGYRWINCDYGY